MKRKPEEIAQMIGMLLMGSGYENLLLELASIEEKNFEDPGSAVKETDTPLGPMSRFEKAVWTLATRIEEETSPKLEELRKHVCPSCSVCGDADMENAPCKDLLIRATLPDQLRQVMWDSIRKRFGHIPAIAIRTGFIAVKCPPSRPTPGIEVIEIGVFGSMGGAMSSILASMRSRFRG